MSDLETSEFIERQRSALVAMAVESWRLIVILNKMLSSVDFSTANRYYGKIRWFEKRCLEALEQAKLKLVSYDNVPYDPGIPATAINADELSSHGFRLTLFS